MNYEFLIINALFTEFFALIRMCSSSLIKCNLYKLHIGNQGNKVSLMCVSAYTRVCWTSRLNSKFLCVFR